VLALFAMPPGSSSSSSRAAAKPKVKASIVKAKGKSAGSAKAKPAAALTTPRPKPSKKVKLVDAKAVKALIDKHLCGTSVPRIPQCPYRHEGIRVGSACSGWCSELFALESMKAKFTSCFCCDNDPHVKTLLSHLHDHHLFIDDVTSDEFFAKAPTVDFFMAGFPCQTFSAAGLGAGTADHRGSVVFFIIHWLEHRQPRCFLLENVEGLYTRHSSTLLLVLELINGLRDSHGKQLYKTTWKVLNARTHGGLPQNRSRLFIAGVRARDAVGEFKWPGEAGASRAAPEDVDVL
jgi:hypothetical protein